MLLVVAVVTGGGTAIAAAAVEEGAADSPQEHRRRRRVAGDCIWSYAQMPSVRGSIMLARQPCRRALAATATARLAAAQ